MTTSDHPGSSTDREYSFESFRFVPAQQLLLNGDTPVRLGSRALDILAELVERAGEVVGKRELIARAWPRNVVEDSNLKVHVAALRRALGEDGREQRYVATVSGRGYRFVAPVVSRARETLAQPEPLRTAWEQVRKLPAPASRATGRDETIAALLNIMDQRRLVSIVGPGGIGKSTVALPLAEMFIARAGMEICFVDLGPLADWTFVVGAVAAALGITVHSGDGVPSLAASLRERRLLLVLDSCEHLIEAVAVLVERIMSAASALHVLATSREPLRVAGEYVYRLTPLAYPAPGGQLDAAQALLFPAIQLFVLRASECLDGYALSDADAPAVTEICRRLEGIPLAIELAATRMDALGAPELAARLGDRFQLLKRGRRTALERHRSLETALDWSYELLSASERGMLRFLSVFAGAFTLDAATALCQDDRADAAMVVEGVANLVDKSLLTADVTAPCVHYRLLETTKAYALERLDQHGETDLVRRRHLEFLRALFSQASDEWDTAPGADWLEGYGRYLDDVRAALAWAFGPGGASGLGIALTVAAIPLWMQLSLLEEMRQRAERALAGAAGERPEALDEMKLRAALGAAILYVSGPVPAAEAAWARVLELAEQRQDIEYQLMALWGMAIRGSYAGQLPAVLALSVRFHALASTGGSRPFPDNMDRQVAAALHYSGDQPAARRHLQQLLERPAELRSSRLARFHLHQRSAALGTLANVLWLQGFPDQAVSMARAAMQEARDSRHAPSILHAISNAAFPVMVHTGDYEGADQLLAELSEYLKTHALTLWESSRSCLQATLQVLRGDASALPEMEQAVARLRQDGYQLHLGSHLGRLAAAMGVHGRRDAGLALIAEALAYCEAGEERWCHAELLRIKGGLLEQSAAAVAEQLYRQALGIAMGQGALSWQLRAASSLARLAMRQGGPQDARRLLGEVHGQFTEGFDTADLLEARRLLDLPDQASAG
jgi:predicted ATPase/DNA-binding winged helix-turn-helix (wHTH) protein